MAEVASIAGPAKKARVLSGTKFAAYSIGDALGVARVIHERGGGRATHDQLAAYLDYKSAKNGAYNDLLASAKLAGLITSEGGVLRITERAQSILMPVYPESARAALIEAFLAVPLFKAVYEEYHGKELPPEFGLKNALRTRFGIVPGRTDNAYRALMQSAEQAGFFEVKGSRTQLIMPSVPTGMPRQPPPADSGSLDSSRSQHSGGGGGDDGRPTPPPAKTSDELKNEYVAALIGLLRDKGSAGDVDAALMERIEKLLGLPQ